MNTMVSANNERRDSYIRENIHCITRCAKNALTLNASKRTKKRRRNRKVERCVHSVRGSLWENRVGHGVRRAHALTRPRAVVSLSVDNSASRRDDLVPLVSLFVIFLVFFHLCMFSLGSTFCSRVSFYLCFLSLPSTYARRC